MVKVIHYFWFGHNPLPKKAIKCIDSWKKYFPDFEIKRWDESNFDVHQCQYVDEAYRSGKWAFVSDYARFWVLEKYGGLYFDTDVEVIRPMTGLLEIEAFTGFESDLYVNPGLILWSKQPHHPIISAMREQYNCIPFLDDNGNRIRKNVCGHFSDLLKNYGFIPNGQLQDCCSMRIFPKDFFNPFDDATGLLHKTKNTYTIHWYDKSWMSKGRILRNRCTRILHRIFGVDVKKRLYRLVGKNV